MALLYAKSTAVDVLKASNAGIVVTFDEKKPENTFIDEICVALYSIINSVYSPEKVNWEAFNAYSAEAMTEKLACAFDDLLKGEKREH